MRGSIVFILTFAVLVYSRPAPCTLGEDLFNSLLGFTYSEKDGAGIQPAIAIVENSLDALEHNLTSDEFNACMQAYFKKHVVSDTIKPLPVGKVYQRPNLPPKLTVPEPSDNYAIPLEGYTTYLQPYNFNAIDKNEGAIKEEKEESEEDDDFLHGWF